MSYRTIMTAAASCCLALGLVACTSSSSSEGKPAGQSKSGGVFRLPIVEPTAIDPYNSQESEGQSVTKQIFDGLTDVDSATATVRPAVATSWKANPSCTTWTFHLGASRFSTGEAVTAQSFIDGMNRAARRHSASDTATFMSDIRGFDEVHGTTSQPNATLADTMSGLTAPDPRTLVIELATANCEFDKVTVQPVFLPVPKGTPDPSNTAYQDKPVGNGPFMLQEPWQHNASIRLVRNSMYLGARPAHLDEVDFTILPDSSAIQAMYKGFESGLFDYSRIPPELYSEAKSRFEPKGEFLHTLGYGINYLGVQIKGPPFGPNNDERARHARRAVSFAIDRPAIAQGVFSGLETPATSLIPPPLTAYAQPGVCDTCTFDAAKAQEEARAAQFDASTKISLEFNTGGGHEAWTSAACDQIAKTLHVTCTPTGTQFKQLLKDEQAPNGTGLFRGSWSADYPSPLSFLEPLLGSRSGDNRGKYSNPQFDQLLAKAKATSNVTDRIMLIRQAESMAVGTDVGLIPMFYRDLYGVANSSKFKNIHLDFFENPNFSEITQS